MSVLIKGMDMPKSCSKCELRYIAIGLDFQCAISGETVDDFYETRHPNCALVAISTPHGRLIDAYALYMQFKNEYCNKNCDTNVRGKICDHCGVPKALKLIHNAPTIIKAEVSEE